MAESTEPEPRHYPAYPGGDRQKWDRLVREHLALVWSRALAAGLSREDAIEVCDLVWRNAAQRLYTLPSGAARAYLLDSVARESRRMLRLRAARRDRTTDTPAKDAVNADNVIRLDAWIPARAGFGLWGG